MNSDVMEVNAISSPEPNDFHKEIHNEATQHFKKLVSKPDDSYAKSQLKLLNDRILQRNRDAGYTKTDLYNCTIPYDKFIATFQMAAPYAIRLKKNASDKTAREKFDDLNNVLKDTAKKDHLPLDWCMGDPVHTENEEISRPQTARDKNQSRKVTRSNTSLNRESISSLPRFRKITREPGYVLDQGIKKKIKGCIKVGFGHQFLLEQPGCQNFHIYELVKASTFGRGAANSYKALPNAGDIVLGKKNELKGKELNEVRIAGVASVRRDMKNEPKRGWQKEPTTYLLVGFGDSIEEFKWYNRSLLGQEFGQAVIDEETEAFRKDAGQKPPRGRPQLIDLDDEDEGSIPLGDEYTEDEDNEDDEDDNDDEEDEDEDEEIARLERELEERKKSQRRKATLPRSRKSTAKKTNKSRKTRK